MTGPVGRGILDAPLVYRGAPSRGGPARPGPPFLPEEMGGKKGRGASPTLAPPVRGFMAAESCTDKTRTGRASTPGSFLCFVTGAAAPRVARVGVTLQALKVAALYRLGPPGRRRCCAAEIPGQSSQPSVGRDDPVRLMQGRPAPLEGGTGRRGRRPLGRPVIHRGTLDERTTTGRPVRAWP